LYKNEEFEILWNDEHKIPFAQNYYEWIGYEDVDSLKLKAQYVVDNDLKGAMIWVKY
jgi:chitinase